MSLQRTSLEARRKIEPRMGSINHTVYTFIAGCGLVGATDQEIETVTHLDGNTVRPSRGALVKKGLVSDSGRTRKNKNGNECIVWIATEEGMLL
jgi:hypothetical protein